MGGSQDRSNDLSCRDSSHVRIRPCRRIERDFQGGSISVQLDWMDAGMVDGTRMITETDQKRLAEIRATVEKHRALGWDVDTWESSFFLNLIEKLRKRG